MPRYLVQWEIDIAAASSPYHAARQAFEIMQRPGSSANAFTVIEFDSDGESVPVDLSDPSEQWQEVAKAEGWGVFYGGKGATIQRDDEAETFPDDTDAWRYIWQRMQEGSAPHAAALEHVEEDNPDEYELIREFCEAVANG